MNSKTKQPAKGEVKCQNCKTDFTIEPEDFEFYKKIDVPEPTFCPECRFQRRSTFQNEGNIHKRKCDFSGKDIFSVFSPKANVKVYDQKIWWSDKWDALEYGRDYDFDKPLLKQIKKLSQEVPWLSRVVKDDINSDYSMQGSDLKNCYLLFFAGHCEDCAYGNGVDRSKNCYDNYHLRQCELCYESFKLDNCYKTFHSSHCNNCQEIYFCKDCVDCQNCFGCANLRHEKYHIFNKPYEKEEYFKKLKEFNLGSYQNNINLFKQAKEHFFKYPVKFIHGRKNVNVNGDYLDNCKDVKDSYLVKKGENLRYCNLIWDTAKDCYDYYSWGENASLIYETVLSGLGLNRIKFCFNCWPNCRNLEYCMSCHSSSNLFGCVGLKHKQYCILNKQYTKEEYEELVPRIKKHMNDMPYTDKKGRVYKYGEFFPAELSPHAYNITIAQEYFPLTQQQALDQGYNWYDESKPEYSPAIQAKDLPDDIKDVDDAILKEVIQCSSSKCIGSNAFRIIPQEFEFYKKQNVSLPRLCPKCRHRERIKQRNPLKLWHRTCMKKGCNTEFETSYAPDRKEIVYCEDCYLKEIG